MKCWDVFIMENVKSLSQKAEFCRSISLDVLIKREKYSGEWTWPHVVSPTNSLERYPQKIDMWNLTHIFSLAVQAILNCARQTKILKFRDNGRNKDSIKYRCMNGSCICSLFKVVKVMRVLRA